MTGGQQWLDYNAGKLSVPMGWPCTSLKRGEAKSGGRDPQTREAGDES